MKARNIIGLTALALCLGLSALTGCKPSGPTREQLLVSNDSLLTLTLRQSNDMADLMQVMNEVTNELDQLNGTIPVATGSDLEQQKSRREDLLAKLAQVRQQIADKQAQIDDLQKKYSGVLGQNKELKRTVDRLQKDIAAYEERVQQYSAEIAAKAEEISTLQQDLSELGDSLNDVIIENMEQASVISEQDRMLNRGYYIFGTKKELRDRDLIVSGIFKASRINEKGFNTSVFTEVDIREFSGINLGKNKVTLLSAMPEDSYELVRNDDGTTQLVVTDAPKFWSLTRYLVVLIK